MSSSATSAREARHRATVQRVLRCAIDLTRDHGFDGWTMEDLAAKSEVSRRTLFNHVASKADAVLGPDPTFPPEALETFRAGGPSGELMPDVKTLVAVVLVEDLLGRDAELARPRQQVLLAEPRLLVESQHRFERVSAEMAGHLLARPDPVGADDARLLFGVFVTIFEHAIDQLQAGSELSLAELFDHGVDDVRRLLG